MDLVLYKYFLIFIIIIIHSFLCSKNIETGSREILRNLKIGRNATSTCLCSFSHCCWILKQLVVKAFKHSFTAITEILHEETTKKEEVKTSD